MRIVSGGVTDLGRVRTNNEDCFRIVESLNLFVLADGMGGEAHGEVASALAVETIVKHCMDAQADFGATMLGNAEPTWSEKTKRLTSAVHLANKSIYDSAEAHPEQHGMGATVTAAWIDGSKLSIAHVGDSRAYLLRSGNLQQLTSDHSLVAEQVRRGILTAAEAEESEMQSVLLRALGALPDIEVDTDEHIFVCAGYFDALLRWLDAHGHRTGNCGYLAGGDGSDEGRGKADRLGQRARRRGQHHGHRRARWARNREDGFLGCSVESRKRAAGNGAAGGM